MKDQIDAVIGAFVAAGEPVGGTYGEGTVVAAPQKVDRVLQNLITNALEHGGNDVRILGDAAGANYVVAVEDNGDGLPESVATAFLTGDAIDGSPETGLSATRALVSELGGSLDYERIPGRTSFVLWLPITWDSDLVGADER